MNTSSNKSHARVSKAQKLKTRNGGLLSPRTSVVCKGEGQPQPQQQKLKAEDVSKGSLLKPSELATYLLDELGGNLESTNIRTLVKEYRVPPHIFSLAKVLLREVENKTIVGDVEFGTFSRLVLRQKDYDTQDSETLTLRYFVSLCTVIKKYKYKPDD